MVRCKYAGDPEDEYCKSCDGIKMIVDGKECSCSECAGYEAGEDVKEEEPAEKKDEDAADADLPFVEE